MVVKVRATRSRLLERQVTLAAPAEAQREKKMCEFFIRTLKNTIKKIFAMVLRCRKYVKSQQSRLKVAKSPRNRAHNFAVQAFSYEGEHYLALNLLYHGLACAQPG